MWIITALVYGLVCQVCPSSQAFHERSDPGQEPKAVVAVPVAPAGERRISGTIIDGLERPITGVSVEVRSSDEKKSEILGHFVSGEGGRFSGTIPENLDEVELILTKPGYVYTNEKMKTSEQLEYTMYRKIIWEDLQLAFCKIGDDLEQEVRELLASKDGPESSVLGDNEDNGGGRRLADLFFEYQEVLRPSLRRLTQDRLVGEPASISLDAFANPADNDLFPKRRVNAPKHEISEADLIEGIKAISGKYNWFSDAPEPTITIHSICFTPNLDRALVHCGINLGPLTGVYWDFVFYKQEKRWVLRSVRQTGRA